jgi:hypothetical protein
MKTLVGLFALLAALSSTAQAASVHHWSQRFGSASTDQNGNGVAVDAGGNVFLAGNFWATVNFGGLNLTSAGAGDIFIASYDNGGGHRWSARFGDTNPNQFANAVATDPSGNVLVAGNHWGTVDFGGGPLTSAGGDDVFLVKLDSDGDHVWSKRFGDPSTDQTGRTVAVDASGEACLGGSFAGTIDFGSGSHSSLGGVDVYVAKFAANGTSIWSRRFGGVLDQVLESVAVDGSGNVILCGYFSGTVDFGGLPLTALNNDIFLVKLDSDGDHVWSGSFGSGNDQEGAAVAVDGTGAIFAAGRFESTVNFGGSTLSSVGGHDVFLAKFTGAGTHTWSKRFGSALDQAATALAVDATGDIVALGNFASTIDFGGGTITNSGSLDIFVARFLGDGSHVWSSGFGGTSDQLGEAVAIDDTERIALAGSFFSTIDFGGGNLTSAGGTDVFLAQIGDEPPDPVFITAFEATALPSAIEIRWELWSDEALDGFTLYRREAGDLQHLVVAEGSASHGQGAVIDRGVRLGASYHYVLVVHTTAGSDIQSQEIAITLPMAKLALTQNHPNPFSVATQFEITVDERGPVRVGVYDIAGRRVRLLDGGVREPGSYGLTWDGRDGMGAAVASGVYFYRVEHQGAVTARRMLLLR